jgi:predicted nuclease of predicted toxin-antitoxin system
LDWLADENIDQALVERMRAAGHDVAYVAELSPGIPDQEVLELARLEGRLLLTSDKDFGELVYRQGLATSGVVLLRLPGLDRGAAVERVLAAVADAAAQLRGRFSVVTPEATRVRKAPAREDR